MIELLDRKIRQMHAALRGLSSDDLSTIQPEIEETDTYYYSKLDFNQNSDPIELANAVSLLIANIASLKDHLKAWCKLRNVQFHGDALINTNRSVALIHDLWNIDKHAELTSLPRSGHKPQLKDLRTLLGISTGTHEGGSACVSFDPRTGKLITSTSNGGSVQLVLFAQIVDENGNNLGNFTTTCNEAVEEWMKVFTEAGVTLPGSPPVPG